MSGREAGSADRVAYLGPTGGSDSLRRSAFRWFPALLSSSCPPPPHPRPNLNPFIVPSGAASSRRCSTCLSHVSAAPADVSRCTFATNAIQTSASPPSPSQTVASADLFRCWGGRQEPQQSQRPEIPDWSWICGLNPVYSPVSDQIRNNFPGPRVQLKSEPAQEHEYAGSRSLTRPVKKKGDKLKYPVGQISKLGQNRTSTSIFIGKFFSVGFLGGWKATTWCISATN